MQHSEFNNIVRDCATYHQEINHLDNKKKAFGRLMLEVDAFGTDYVREFLNQHSSTLSYPCLLSVAFDMRPYDARADSQKIQWQPAVIVLVKPKTKTYDHIEAAADKADEIALDVYSYIFNYFKYKYPDLKYRIDSNGCDIEKVGEVFDGIFGSRLNLRFSGPGRKLLTKWRTNKFLIDPKNWQPEL